MEQLNEVFAHLHQQEQLLEACMSGIAISSEDTEAINTAMKWGMLDEIRENDKPRYDELVTKYVPDLPELVEESHRHGGCPNPATGLILARLCELAQAVTWEDLKRREQ